MPVTSSAGSAACGEGGEGGGQGETERKSWFVCVCEREREKKRENEKWLWNNLKEWCKRENDLERKRRTLECPVNLGVTGVPRL